MTPALLCLCAAFSVVAVPVTSAQDTKPFETAPPHVAADSRALKSSSKIRAPVSDNTATNKNPATSADSTGKSGESDQAFDKNKDGPEQIRKREEWFYKQRSSVNGHIPAGARLRAFEHMQRMMVAEGKLVRRLDGTLAEGAPLAPSTPAWTSIGPAPTTGGTFSPVTGRITTIAVDPSDATGNTVLIGGAQGGIWRSTDAGNTWKAVGDQNPSLAMGSIAFAPSQPATVYAGTGEQAGIGFDIYYGAGVLKSTDHGLTWQQTCSVAGPTCPFIGPYTDSIHPGFGFFNFGGAHISYVAVSPSNPNLVLVGAQFVVEGPREGVYCSDNGGNSWSNVLPDQMSTFVGFASSTVAYAALGNPFGSSPGAPNGNGIYKATAIGATCASVHFLHLTAASLPTQSIMGRIDLGIAPSDLTGSTVYASVADGLNGSNTNLGVFVTTNGGTLWTLTSAPDVCMQQCWYDNVVKVDPVHANIAYFGGSSAASSGNPGWVVRTTDMGNNWATVLPSAPGPGLPHVDTHALAFARLPNGKVRAYLGNDGGIWSTDDAEAATVVWTNLNNGSLTLSQFYPSISIHPSSPTIAFGGTQDNGSQNFQGGTAWVDNGQCGDGTSTGIDLQIPSTVYVTCPDFGGGFPVFASYQGGAQGTFFQANNGINPNDVSNFVAPLVVDPNNPDVVYLGAESVYRSSDAGNSWAPFPVEYNLGPNNGEFLTAMAVAAGNSNVGYVGSSAGILYSTAQLSSPSSFAPIAGPAQLPGRAITAIATDPLDSTGNTVYVAVSGFSFVGTDTLGNSINDTQGHIFKTTDASARIIAFVDLSCSVTNCSTPAATDLPNIPVNDLVLDPDAPGTIYAATDLGVYVGNCTVTPCTWSTLGAGLPHVAVLSLRLHEASRTLRAATHGRGAWDINLNNFSFTGPHISSITPTSENAGGAQFTLTVNGVGLTGGAVQWNAATTGVTMLPGGTDTTLTATIDVSLLMAGTAQITVSSPSATSNALTFSVLAGTPTITSISPPGTPVQTPNPTANVQIQLTGTNFASSAKVLFNGAQNGITVALPTSSCPLPTCLSATLPAALLGLFGSTNDIAVLNSPPGGGKSQPVTFKVVAPPPPNDNFANAFNITPFTFTDVQDSSGATIEFVDPTPPCATQLTSAQGNTGGHPNGVYNTIWYKFTPAVSANLNMDTQSSSYDTVLSVWTGAQGSLTNIACNDDINPGIVLQSQIQNLPLTAGMTYYIMVSSFGPPDPNPIALGGVSVLHFAYTGAYPAPALTSISPTSANSGDPAVTLNLTGSNFFNGAIIQFANVATSFGSALIPTFVSSTQLTAVIPASAITLPGSFQVSVINPFPNFGPSASLPFTVNVGVYPPPTLAFIAPTAVIAGSLPFQLIATGSNFAPSAVLNFNGVSQTTSVAPSAQNAYAIISTTAISTPGTVQVTVSNPTPGGGTSVAQTFVITPPTVVPNISSMSPASAPAGIPTSFTINGTGFTQGAALFVANAGGYYGTNFISSTQLTTPSFAVNALGTFPIYVVDPAPAGTSTAFNLTVTQPPPPTITSISSTGAQSGTSAILNITGTNFQPGANVLFNNQGNFTFNTTVLSTTQVTTDLVLNGVAAGTYSIVVVNPVPSPTSSAPVNFTVTAPPDFSMTSTGTTTQTVSAGQPAMFPNAITISAMGGFSSPVNFSCPPPATATTCTVNPPSLATGSGSVSVTVTTMARGLVPPTSRRLPFNQWPIAIAASFFALLLCARLMRSARTRGQRFATALPLSVLAVFLILQAAGCGGGGGSFQPPPPPPPPTGTPAGNYMITVTGTSGSTIHSTTLQLTVN